MNGLFELLTEKQARHYHEQIADGLQFVTRHPEIRKFQWSNEDNLLWNFFYLAALNDVINADGWRMATPDDLEYLHRTNKLPANLRNVEFGAALLLSWYSDPNQHLAVEMREQITANLPNEQKIILPLVIPIANLGVKDSPIGKGGLLFEIKYFHSPLIADKSLRDYINNGLSGISYADGKLKIYSALSARHNSPIAIINSTEMNSVLENKSEIPHSRTAPMRSLTISAAPDIDSSLIKPMPTV